MRSSLLYSSVTRPLSGEGLLNLSMFEHHCFPGIRRIWWANVVGKSDSSITWTAAKCKYVKEAGICFVHVHKTHCALFSETGMVR